MGTIGQRLLERALSRGRGVRLEVRGGCMDPLIRAGDEVSIRPANRVRSGDVVLARTREGELVCHRVLGPRGGGMLLAGDRSARPELHPPSSILGRVTAVRRRASGRLLDLERGAPRRRRGWRGWRDRREAIGWIARLAARAQLASHRMRHRPAGRLFEAARRRWLAPAAGALTAGILARSGEPAAPADEPLGRHLAR